MPRSAAKRTRPAAHPRECAHTNPAAADADSAQTISVPARPNPAARPVLPPPQALPATAHGVRVSGDPDRPVRRVATACGSGDFLLDTVLGLDADVFLTSDLRHHRAGEFREHERAALVDVAHWAAEWTWLPVVQRKLVTALADRGDTVETRVSTTVTDPWTFRV